MRFVLTRTDLARTARRTLRLHRALGRTPIALSQPAFMNHCLHRLLELLKGYLAVAVLVGLVQDDLPHFLINFVALILLR